VSCVYVVCECLGVECVFICSVSVCVCVFGEYVVCGLV